MARTQLKPPALSLDDADLEAVARIAQKLLVGRPLRRTGTTPTRQRIGVGLEFYDFREYVTGDDLRMIDWRASARSQRLQIRRYHEDATTDWMLCLDRSASMGLHGAAKWRLGAELAAAFAYVLLALNGRVGLLSFSGQVDALCPLGRGQRHYARVLETVGSRPPASRGGESRLESCIAAVTRNTGLIVISDFLVPDAMRGGLASLTALSGSLHAVRIASTDDYRIASAGPITLVDTESSGQRDAVLSDFGEATAENEWREHVLDWERLCGTLRIQQSIAWVGQSWKDALLDHLMLQGRCRA